MEKEKEEEENGEIRNTTPGAEIIGRERGNRRFTSHAKQMALELIRSENQYGAKTNEE